MLSLLIAKAVKEDLSKFPVDIIVDISLLLYKEGLEYT